MEHDPTGLGETGLSAAEINQALSAAFGVDASIGKHSDSVLHQLGAAVADARTIVLRRPGAPPNELPRPAVGTAGRFELLGELGRGGLGVVMRGRDVDLGREVAMKVLHQRHAQDAGMVQKLVEEAQVGGQLQHPGIVPVYEMGIDPEGRPFFAMKLVDGQTLAALLRQRRTPSEDRDRLLSVFVQVCQAIGYAHARGVVHRDVKPSNVMVGAFGEVQVVDWGLAKVLDRPAAERCTSWLAGTPAYMAPEQARGEDHRVDARSDVFGLGAILCEILTGRAPFVGENNEATRLAAAAADLDAAHAALASCDADAELVALVRRCLDPDPAQRPGDGGAVARAIEGHVASIAARARAADLQLVRAETRAAEERRRRRLVVAFAAVGLLAVMLVGGGYLWYVGERSASRAAADGRVQLAVERTQTALGAARARGLDEVAWRRAEVAAREAVALAASGEVTADLRARADTVLAEADHGQRAAAVAVERRAAEDRTRERLRTIREEHSDDWYADASRSDAAYAEVFTELDIDVGALSTEEAARRVRDSALAGELLAALDDWTRMLRKDKASRDWRPLAAIASAAETDPSRRELRRVLQRGDLAAIRQLVAVPDRPDWPAPTLCLLAQELLFLGDREAARTVLAEGQRRHPDDLWLDLDLAALLSRDGPESAREACRFYAAATALRPQSARIRIDLARSYDRSGQRDAARIEAEEAVRLRPANPEAYNELGALLLEWRAFDEAEVVVRVGLAQGRSSWILGTLGAILNRLGRTDEAYAVLQEALDLGPVHYETLVNLGPVLRALGRLDEAEARLRQAIAMRPKAGEAHLNLGVLLESRGDRAGARAEYEAATHLDPGLATAWNSLGRVLVDEHALESAADAHRHAFELDPDNPLYRWALGHALYYTGDLSGAIEHLRAAEAAPPADRHQHLLLLLADCLEQRGDTDLALDYARRALSTEPRIADTCFDLGRLFVRHGCSEDALAAFRLARDLGDPTAERAVAECERVMALADDFRAVLAGEHPVGSPNDLVHVANVLWRRGEFITAATMVHEVMAVQGAEARPETLLFAAEVAVRAGFGTPDAMPDNADADAWRSKAISWLRWALDAHKARVQSLSGSVRGYHYCGLAGWRRLPQFAVIRDWDRLTRFPEPQRRELLAFWMDHGNALEALR